MFSGLFKQQRPVVQKNPARPQKKQFASQELGKSKGAYQSKRGTKNGRNTKEKRIEAPVTVKAAPATAKAEPKLGKASLTRIPMTDEEAEAFLKWRQEHFSEAGTGKKRKQAEVEDTDATDAAPTQQDSSQGALSKKARKKLRQQMAQDARSESQQDQVQPSATVTAPIETLSKKARKKLRQMESQSSTQDLAKQPSQPQKSQSQSASARLQGSRFRMLNEKLYSITGAEAKELYEEDPTLAAAYHEGFREQARKWPRNPLDDIIKWLSAEVSADKVIGDFGCGDARLALELKGRKVHSFDLVKINERVTPCNLAAVPLKEQTIDVAVFCLALMGTDWPQFVQEAHRCLKHGGTLQIVEVESRIKDLNEMVSWIEATGFQKVFVKKPNFFTEMRFVKAGASKNKTKSRSAFSPGDVLARCEYRRR